MTSTTSIDLSLETTELVILGTEYAGEMKKGVFTIMNYLPPKQGVLSMHCSATADRDSGDSSLLFGLSGTGKTTLSADPQRLLIGDDEHCWSDSGIFNIEGGCYAKASTSPPRRSPTSSRPCASGRCWRTWSTTRTRATSTSTTTRHHGEHPRGLSRSSSSATPRSPAWRAIPTNVIFLTCDAFGVLPPVSRLTPAQAMYHFISGYTAKVAGTEMGVTEPQATFSPCFGGPFLVWPPTVTPSLLAEKLQQHGAAVWLVNTGWSGGAYGTGKRMKLPFTRRSSTRSIQAFFPRVPRSVHPIFGTETMSCAALGCRTT